MSVTLALLSLVGLVNAAPVNPCAAWLNVLVAGEAPEAKTVAAHWDRAIESFKGRGAARAPWFTRIARAVRARTVDTPVGVAYSDASPETADVVERLTRARRDLDRTPENRVSVNQVIVGDEAIRRHLAEAQAQLDLLEADAAAPPEVIGLRRGSFVRSAFKGVIYAGIAGLLYVNSVEFIPAERWMSVTLALTSAGAVSVHARNLITNALNNARNGRAGSRAAPAEVPSLARAEREFIADLTRKLDAMTEGTVGLLSLDVPLARAISAMPRARRRAAVSAADLADATAWPSDPRIFRLDRVLSYDPKLKAPVLLVFGREGRYVHEAL